MSLGERLKQLRQETGLTQAQLSSSFNLAESTISLYESDKRSPDYELLIRFASHFHVSVDYLLGNTNERSAAQTINETNNYYSYHSNEDNNKIPIIKKVQMKSAKLFFEEISPDKQEIPYIKYEKLFWFCVPDDSMTPDGIFQDDLVLVKKQKKIQDGDIGLFVVNKEDGRLYRMYKKENSTVLQPSNSKYAPRIFSCKECLNISIVGKVLEVRRRL